AVNRGTNELKPLGKHALANIYYRAGVQLVKQNCYREAREYFFRELQCRPLKIESWIYLIMSMTGPVISKPLIKFKKLLWKYFGN
ncbi:hypothetical protein JZU51_01995, partial [bacterium]|nr:hypothetical protein [bacterium]